MVWVQLAVVVYFIVRFRGFQPHFIQVYRLRYTWYRYTGSDTLDTGIQAQIHLIQVYRLRYTWYRYTGSDTLDTGIQIHFLQICIYTSCRYTDTIFIQICRLIYTWYRYTLYSSHTHNNVKAIHKQGIVKCRFWKVKIKHWRRKYTCTGNRL